VENWIAVYNGKTKILFPMSNQALSNEFIFNEQIDKDYIYSLYADDYVYIEEMFTTTSNYLDPDIESIQLAFSAGNTADLKRAVHKIKPAFGFAGLLAVQETCKSFEDLCQQHSSTDGLSKEYKHLITILKEGKNIIETERKRLKDFNANQL
jgi:HPt (histidine-containing phosphotransfer) domain-containing protein